MTSDATGLTTVFNAYIAELAFDSSQSSEFRSIWFSLYMRRSAVQSMPVVYDTSWENQIVSHTTLSLKRCSQRSRSWNLNYTTIQHAIQHRDSSVWSGAWAVLCLNMASWPSTQASLPTLSMCHLCLPVCPAALSNIPRRWLVCCRKYTLGTSQSESERCCIGVGVG